MSKYLSPGVYVEEFDAGIKAMEGVGTSTAGFIGMAQKGPIRGRPVLITSMADYQRRFGGYLSGRDYKDMRYLPYAVEQFFNNGGSACYIMRVCKEAAKVEENTPGDDNDLEKDRDTNDDKQAEITEWTIISAWPTKYTASDFNASNNEVAIETLELAHEGVTRDK